MSLPPIIANLPFIKLFRSESADKSADKSSGGKKAESGGEAGDIVHISQSARVRLSATGAKDAAEARATAHQAKEQLAREQVSLGLSPDFS
jgi:hypothetical protein